MTDNSTAVATTEQARPRPPALQAGGTISAMIPTDIDQAFRLARAIAMSGMAPKSYGNDENKCFVGILAGAELGLAPFQALQSIAVIGGNPSVWGDGALALVRASGLLEDFEETDDGHKATCRVVRRGEKPIIRSFDMQDAERAGLLRKDGPWKAYPQRMRQMRARAWALRDGFADVLKGLHIAEEVRDRPDLVEKPQTTRLSSDMLAQQAGVTVEQPQIAQDEQIHTSGYAEMVEDAEIEEGVEAGDQADAGELSPEAQQTLADLDGPLEQDEQTKTRWERMVEASGQRMAEDGSEDEGPDPREAKAAEIIAKVDRCETIIDLRALHEREQKTIEALPEELAKRVTDAFNVMRAALKRHDGK